MKSYVSALATAALSLSILAFGCSPGLSETEIAEQGGSGGEGGGATTGDGGATSTGTTTPTKTGDSDDKTAEGCDAIYAQDLLPTFELEIDQEVWDQLYDEWYYGYDNKLAGLETKPDHPLKSFKYGDEVVTNAAIRLRGNEIWWHDQNKMQFEISFNKYDKKGRFHGLRNIVFDAAASNSSFLRDRLSFAILRDAGVIAPCANNARVMVNGEYYGLFTNIEKIDKSFLKRTFDDNDGDLWKRSGWELKTNEETSDDTRLDALKNATTIEELSAYLDLETATLEWAGEAAIPDNDGAWAGGLNFYLYDDPTRGKFVLLPWDMDSTLVRVVYDADPITYEKEPQSYGRPLYDIMISDPYWLGKYKEKVKHVLETAYKVEVLQERVDTWGAQIEKAAEQDVNKPFTQATHVKHVQEMREYVAQRAAFLENWVCYQEGGADIDGDGTCDAPSEQ